jgi:hypothetical protein
LVPLYKDARNKKLKTKWSGDKLLIDDKIHEARRDTISNINCDPTEVATGMKVTRAPPKTYRGSTFQGAKVEVKHSDDIIPGLYGIYSDQRCARATHNIYAYRIRSADGTLTEHYNDDSEFGAGRRLLELMTKSNVENQMVCVTRWYGGTHLGPARFQHILEAANTVINFQ